MSEENQAVESADPPAPDPAPSAEAPAGPPAEGDSFWPDGWRERLAGDDEKTLKMLERSSSVEDWFKSGVELRRQRDSGDWKKELLDRPEDEKALAKWRQDRNIPEAADKYDLTFDDGLVVGDEDKELLGSFAERLHDKDASNDVMKEAVRWYYDHMEQRQAEQAERDEDDRISAMADLRNSWGPDAKTNLVALESFIGRLPEDVRDLFRNSRLADGTAALNHPGFIQAVVAMEREVNPTATLPVGSGDAATNINARLGELREMMKDRKVWFSDDNKARRDEYESLLETEKKLGARK